MDKAKRGKVIERYERLKQLGHGASAVVYRGLDHKKGNLVALKVFKRANDYRTNQERIINKCLRDLGGHPNIIAFLGEYHDANSGHVVLVFENAPGGNVYSRLVDLEAFSEADASVIIGGILKGLEFLHGHGIIHRDLRPENVLLRRKEFPLEPALADFGVSERLGPDGRLPFTLEGTLGYSSPENISEAYVGKKVDIFPVGIIMVEILSGEHPFGFDAVEENELVKNIQNVESIICRLGFCSGDAKCRGVVDKFYSHISREGRELASRLLQKKEELRPNATDALRKIWFETASEARNLSAKGLNPEKRKVRVADVVDRDKRRNAQRARERKKLGLRERQEQPRVTHADTQGRPHSKPPAPQAPSRPSSPAPKSNTAANPKVPEKASSDSLSTDFKGLSMSGADSDKHDGTIQSKVKTSFLVPRVAEVKRGRRHTELMRRRERIKDNMSGGRSDSGAGRDHPAGDAKHKQHNSKS